MKLTVKQTTGEPMEVTECEATDDVVKLRQALASKLSKKAEDIRIIFSGRILKDGKTLGDYKLSDGSTLHAVVTSRPEAKTAEPPSSSPATSLFRPPPQRQQAPSGASGEGVARDVQSQLSAALGNEQLMQQLLQSNPSLTSSDLRRLLSHPMVQQRILQEYMNMTGEDGEQRVSRQIFDDAMRFMNGERLQPPYPSVRLNVPFPRIPLPGEDPAAVRREQLQQLQQQQQQQGQQGQQGQQAGGGVASIPPQPLHEYVSRSDIAAALRTALGEEAQQADAGEVKKEEEAEKKGAEAGEKKEEEEAGKEATKEGGASGGSAMDTQPDASEATATTTTTTPEGQQQQQQQQQQQSPAERYAAQLRQLREMGFTDEQACIQALERANGSINIALQHLFG